jgi:GT2 family glycosyltransferase
LVIENAIVVQTQRMLDAYFAKYTSVFTRISFPDNQGSAGGFNAGIRAAENLRDCNYFWLLDDDNCPGQGSLQALLDQYGRLSEAIPSSHLALQSYRIDWRTMRDMVRGVAIPVMPRPGVFIGFHVFNLGSAVKRLLFATESVSDQEMEYEDGRIELYHAPYGGFFFHRDTLQLLGYPDARLFLYADDTEYTLRFTRAGGRIFLVRDSVVRDIDPAWDERGSSRFNISRRLLEKSGSKVYYEVRNRIYLSRNILSGGRLVYLLNKYVYLSAALVLAFRYRCFDRFWLLVAAVHDGEKGKLGQFEYAD